MQRSSSTIRYGDRVRITLLAMVMVPAVAARADLRSEINALQSPPGRSLANGELDLKVAAILRQPGLVTTFLPAGVPPLLIELGYVPSEMKVIEPWILGRAGGVGIIITDNIRDDSGWTPWT